MKMRDLIREAEDALNKEAGTEAPPEVQEAILRWQSLPEEERRDQPLLYWLLGSGTPEYKMDPEYANYTDESTVDNQTCANCEFTYLKIANKKFICSQISGGIHPNGWCRLWQKGSSE